jgi:hypothetical protein
MGSMAVWKFQDEWFNRAGFIPRMPAIAGGDRQYFLSHIPKPQERPISFGLTRLGLPRRVICFARTSHAKTLSGFWVDSLLCSRRERAKNIHAQG